MSMLDAAYWTGRDYPGGIEALAARLGRPNLSDELNPRRPNAKLGLMTALDMQVMSGDCRILYAMAAELRHYPPVPMLPADSHADPQAMTALAETAKEFADLLTTVSGDLADGDVSDNDLARAQREGGELVAKVQALLGRLAHLNAQSKQRAGFST